MMAKSSELTRVVNAVHNMMRLAKKLKNAAILRSLTDYKPITENKMRWSMR